MMNPLAANSWLPSCSCGLFCQALAHSEVHSLPASASRAGCQHWAPGVEACWCCLQQSLGQKVLCAAFQPCTACRRYGQSWGRAAQSCLSCGIMRSPRKVEWCLLAQYEAQCQTRERCRPDRTHVLSLVSHNASAVERLQYPFEPSMRHSGAYSSSWSTSHA